MLNCILKLMILNIFPHVCHRELTERNVKYLEMAPCIRPVFTIIYVLCMAAQARSHFQVFDISLSQLTMTNIHVFKIDFYKLTVHE